MQARKEDIQLSRVQAGEPLFKRTSLGSVRLEKNPALEESIRVSRLLQNGITQARLCSDVRNVAGYGVGCMLARLAQKGMLKNERSAILGLRRSFTPRGSHADMPYNRRTVLEVLRKIGQVDQKIGMRALKPIGTTPTVSQVIEVIERSTLIPAEDILSKKRSKPIVSARFRVMWVLRQASGMSLASIGDNIGGRDHTSVINGINQIDIERQTQISVIEETERLMDEADHMAIQCSLDILVRQVGLRQGLYVA